MAVNTKIRYAVDAMVDLALRERHGPVALAAIARRQRVSLSYLEQLFASLRRRELVRATRGPGGGYTLGRNARDILVGDIAAALDDDDAAVRTASRAGEMNAALWQRLRAVLRAEMDEVTLDSLAQAQRDLGEQLVEPTKARSPFSAGPTAVVRPLRPANSVFALAQAQATSAEAMPA